VHSMWQQQSQHQTRATKERKPASGQGNLCHICDKPGHYARECPTAPGGTTRPPRGSCYSCGLPGHQKKDCPTKGTSNDSGGTSRRGRREGGGGSKRNAPTTTSAEKCGFVNSNNGGPCGSTTHIRRNCPNNPERAVPRCGRAGTPIMSRRTARSTLDRQRRSTANVGTRTLHHARDAGSRDTPSKGAMATRQDGG
jgi:hypothetical protein